MLKVLKRFRFIHRGEVQRFKPGDTIDPERYPRYVAGWQRDGLVSDKEKAR